MSDTKYITIYRSAFTEDDICDGDINYRNTIEEIVICDDPEASDLTAVQYAADYLSGESLTAPSCYPVHEADIDHLWYSHVDGSIILNHYTGLREEASAHLRGFSTAELIQIAELTGNKVTRQTASA